MQKLLDSTGAIIENDPWRLVTESHEITSDDKYLLLPLDLWLEQETNGTCDPTWGICLDSADEIEPLGNRLSELPCIAINFPTFMDGRGFSTARIIREQYGYEGPLRALGQIMPEQLLFLARCGFDSFIIDGQRNIPDPRIYFDEFSVTYQSSNDRPEPLFRRRA
ncbi:MAG TPA: oxidoreductase [Porticoccaceae bacterium]|nr:oxidoreductase [Porticoccaceae bacterium]HCO60051.1 oxidoreductase [Porticoccaceae bacterium]